MRQNTQTASGRAFPGTIDGTTGKTTKEANERAAGEPEGKNPVPRPDPAIEKKIALLSKRMDKVEEARAELNAEAAEIRAAVKKLDVDVATFMYDRRIAKKDEEDRERIDLTHVLVRQALGKPLQTDWVDISKGHTKN